MPHVEIMDGQDVTFRGGEVSVMSNLQFPNEQLVYYFEVKVEVLPTGTDLAVGISMRPYPPLRMAGWADNSVAYHTLDGGVIFSCGSTNAVAAAAGDTATMPGDTIGFGWRPRSGKLFVTRNGEFIAKHQVPWARKRLYPVVSADGPCKVSVNFGSRGFVLAKANTNCWGLAPPQGLGPPPPMYGCDDESILLAYTPLGQLEQQQRPGHSSHGSQGSSLSLGSMA
ncbi:Protein ssh4, partial [Spiromyces aspiralis]